MKAGGTRIRRRADTFNYARRKGSRTEKNKKQQSVESITRAPQRKSYVTNLEVELSATGDISKHTRSQQPFARLILQMVCSTSKSVNPTREFVTA